MRHVITDEKDLGNFLNRYHAGVDSSPNKPLPPPRLMDEFEYQKWLAGVPLINSIDDVDSLVR